MEGEADVSRGHPDTNQLPPGMARVEAVDVLRDVLGHTSVDSYVVGEELMRRAFENATVGSYILGPDDRLLRVNAALCELLGSDADALVGTDIAAITDPDAMEVVDEPRVWLRPGEVHRSRSEQRWVHRNGHIVDIELAASAIGGLDGRPAYTIGQVQDISRRRADAARVAHVAMHDPLTDLPNRALFLDRLNQGLRRLERNPGLLAVLFVDVDRFKQVNDCFGHAAGDRALIGIASRVTAALRAADTLARFGGDEFTILCENLEDSDAVLGVAARILDAVAAPLRLDGRFPALSASVGIAMATDASADAESLLHHADLAMYQAKERGRNRCEIFDETLRAHTLARIDRAAELRRAIDQGELRVHFQPLVRLGDGSTTGMEALVRWDHPDMGVLHPDTFVRVAEETGQIMALGTWVLQEACRQVASWTPGFAPPEFSINLSAQQLGHPELEGVIREALDATGLSPARLCLEITESVLMDDVESSIEALVKLKRLGVRIAIDDFGTGYSSLSYLRRLEVDVVKIDGSFIAGLGTDSASDAIVAAVVNVAHALSVTVVAEGVETEEQLVALRALGCDQGQGYYWCRPQPAAELARWLHSERPATVTARPADVYSILTRRLDAVRAATGRRVVLQASERLPQAFADPTAVKLVVDHLLSNALTYSPPDRPVIVSAGSDRRWVRASVADFGIGMSADATARCFEQFWQARESDTPRPRGPGIGLYIVRSLVEAMGGHVAVKSAPGRGSTFSFSLPRNARSAAHAHSKAGLALDVGAPSIIQEGMRQIGVPMRRPS